MGSANAMESKTRLEGGDGSQQTDDSDHEEILQMAFGVTRSREESKDKDERAIYLADHRKKEAERKQHER